MDCDSVSRDLKEQSAQKLAKESDPVERFRLQALGRGCAAIKNIARRFRVMDDDRSHRLDINEFITGSRDMGLKMSDDELMHLFNIFDKDNSGTINFDEFLAAVRPPMNEFRRCLVKKAFKKISTVSPGYDRTRIQQQQQQQMQQMQQMQQQQMGQQQQRSASRGRAEEEEFITYEDLACVYTVEEHPKYKNGEMTKRQVIQQFLDNFQPGSKEKDDKVTLEEFMDYYSAISQSVDIDSYFSFIMSKSWGVNPVD